MKFTETNLAAAFQPHANAAAAWYANLTVKLFGEFSGGADEIPGETRKKLNRNANGRQYHDWAHVRRYTDAPDYFTDSPVTLNLERVAISADRFGQDQVVAYVAKLVKKIEDLEEVTLHSLYPGAGEFTISGTRDGRKVTVRQQRVFKHSPKGKLFIQWPARIYVDGQFTPEAEYKALFRKEA